MYWFHHLEDKTAQYVFSATEGFRAPRIYFCTSDGPGGINDYTPTTTGFVIRATNLHSSHGIYVLPDGYGSIELLNDKQMTLSDVKADLERLGATDILVEEYIPGFGDTRLPTEYKVHAFNGEIGSFNVVLNRGTDCACWAEVDENWNRLDQNGCFTPSDSTDSAGTCETAIAFATGQEQAYPIKGLNLCSEVPRPEDCVLADLITVAKEASKKIGVAVRVDMFVSITQEIVVQEYTMNHMNGLRHCSSKTDDNGCIDPCFLGAMWEEASRFGNPLFGGPLTPVPAGIAEWKADLDKCLLAMETSVNPQYKATCALSDTIETGPPLLIDAPSGVPSGSASAEPSTRPSVAHSGVPSGAPSHEPSPIPSVVPSGSPSVEPSTRPSVAHSGVPSGTLSHEPSDMPTVTPSRYPSLLIDALSVVPSVSSSEEPSTKPSVTHSRPSQKASTTSSSVSAVPSNAPSNEPSGSAGQSSNQPSTTPSLSVDPSSTPSMEPSDSAGPSPNQPSTTPSLSVVPSSAPSKEPSDSAGPSSNQHSTTPSLSVVPSSTPSIKPIGSAGPSSNQPSTTPGLSVVPSSTPSKEPNARIDLSNQPSTTASLSVVPSSTPSMGPSSSIDPSNQPSTMPSLSVVPSSTPSKEPRLDLAS